MIRRSLALTVTTTLGACSGAPDGSDDSPTSSPTPALASPSSPPETVSESTTISTDVPTSSSVTQTPQPDVSSSPPATFAPEPTVPPGSEPTLPPGVTRLFYFPQIEGADYVQFSGGELHVADMDGDGQLDMVLSSAAVDQGTSTGVGCLYMLLAPLAPVVAANLDYALKICGDFSGEYLGAASTIVDSMSGGVGPEIAFSVKAADEDCAILKIVKSHWRGSYSADPAYFSLTNDTTCASPYANEVKVFDNGQSGGEPGLVFVYQTSDQSSAVSMLSESDISDGATTSQLGASILPVYPNYLYGASLVANVDVDQDGYQDLFIADPIGDTAERGLIYLYNGPIARAEMDSDDADITFVGEESYIQCYGVPFPNCEPIGNEIGRYFAADGDFNGDRNPDLAVLTYQPAPGKIWIVHQPYARQEELRNADAQLVPDDVSTIGGSLPITVKDTNGDGSDELLFLIGRQGRGTSLVAWQTPFSPSPSWSDLCTVRGVEGDTEFGNGLWRGPGEVYYIYGRGVEGARIYEFTHEQLKARIECPSDPTDVKISP